MILLGFSVFLLSFVVLERVLHVLFSFVYDVVANEPAPSSVKSYAGVQVAGSFVTLACALLSSCAVSVISAGRALLSYLLWAVLVSALFSLLYVLVAYFPQELVDLVSYWNSTVGPAYDMLFITPLRVFGMLFSSVVPLWNAFFHITSSLTYKIFIKAAVRDLALFQELGEGLAGFVRASALSLADYLVSLTDFQCTDPPTSACYSVSNSVLDLITPMSHARTVSASLSSVLRSMCGSLSGPIDILLYPFLDINLAKGLHNAVNGLLYPVMQMPRITSRRCKDSGGDLVMCLPDMEPGLNLVVTGMRNIGQLLDNWLDVGSIIVQSSIGLDPGLKCDSMPLSITPLNRSMDLFGANETVVVGLTEGLYAITDGYGAQYFSHYHSVSSSLAPGSWHFPIEPSFGVASVRYLASGDSSDELGEPRTTMLGCRCDDVEGAGVRILCGLALYESEGFKSTLDPERDLTFEVNFHKRSTATQVTCSALEISVQSVRWPSRRYTRAMVLEEDLDDTCSSRGTCTTIDATVWVQPRCSSSRDANQPICRDGNPLASCFP